MQNKKTEPHHQSASTFKPYVSADTLLPEMTPKAVILGALLALVFGAANAYLALRYAITVSASIPAAVISMAVLRTFFKKASPLENNIVQTLGSSGESLAAGIAFTIPAFFIWAQTPALIAQGYQFDLSWVDIFIMSILGGSLGILFMIPLRKYLMETEHGVLPFPEGTACAEIIIAGEEGGSRAKHVFLGMGVGAIYKTVMNGGRLWPETLEYEFKKLLHGGILSMEATPALFGVGFIIGPEIASYMMAGAVLGYLGVAPLLAFIGQQIPGVILEPATAAGVALSDMGAGELRAYYVRYLGVGAVAVGGVFSIVKAAPTIFHSFGAGFRQMFGGAKTTATPRTERDIAMKWVMGGIIFISVAIFFLPGMSINVMAGISAILFGFLFTVVAARIVGQVGSSSSPVSGMTIAALLATAMAVSAFGASGIGGMIATMVVGVVVCLAVSLSGDIAQDLKTGYLLGATPKSQQIMEFVGLIVPATVMGAAIFILNDAYGFVQTAEHPTPLAAPQANVMATLVQGLFMGHGLPWTLILVGGMVAVAVELLGIGSLPFAIGLYLPLSLSTPIMAGGILTWIVRKRSANEPQKSSRIQRGILFASGMVAGDALVGMGLAILKVTSSGFREYDDSHAGMFTTLTGAWGPWVSLATFLVMGYIFYRTARGGRNDE